MYNEILELEKYCNEIGVKTRKISYFGGWALYFQKGDVIQHRGSYGNNAGCVEFGYTGFEEVDFKATTLENAKEFVKTNKDILNEGEL